MSDNMQAALLVGKFSFLLVAVCLLNWFINWFNRRGEKKARDKAKAKKTNALMLKLHERTIEEFLAAMQRLGILDSRCGMHYINLYPRFRDVSPFALGSVVGFWLHHHLEATEVDDARVDRLFYRIVNQLFAFYEGDLNKINQFINGATNEHELIAEPLREAVVAYGVNDHSIESNPLTALTS